MDKAKMHTLLGELRTSLENEIFGQKELIDEIVACFLASGHALMTGAPGLAKTTLVKVFAEHLQLIFGRVQFTADLLPSDITGSEILNLSDDGKKRVFSFQKGPIFVNLLLADEINRASPRTQSALLEAMQERKVTVAGQTHDLPGPFMVLATQNPFDMEGTYPLPEAQIDRFLIHTLVDYPSIEAQLKIVSEHAHGTLVGEQDKPKGFLRLNANDVRDLIAAAHKIRVPDPILAAINDLVMLTRPHFEGVTEKIRQCVEYGASPRAGIGIVSIAKAYALMEGAEHVQWIHVKRMARPVLRHRIKLNFEARRDRIEADQLINDLVESYEHKNQKTLWEV